MRPHSLLAVAFWSLLAVFGVQVLWRGLTVGYPPFPCDGSTALLEPAHDWSEARLEELCVNGRAADVATQFWWAAPLWAVAFGLYLLGRRAGRREAGRRAAPGGEARPGPVPASAPESGFTRRRDRLAFWSACGAFFASFVVIDQLVYGWRWEDDFGPLYAFVEFAFSPRESHAAWEALYLVGMVVTVLPPFLLGLLVWRRLAPRPGDGFLHCLRCDHILKGLTAPRCPECGEAI